MIFTERLLTGSETKADVIRLGFDEEKMHYRISDIRKTVRYGQYDKFTRSVICNEYRRFKRYLRLLTVKS